MDAFVQSSRADSRSPSAGAPVPHRAHSRRTADSPGAPGLQPDPLSRLLRMVVAIGVSILLMLVVLFGAVRYLQRDWADKNRRARSHGHVAASAAAPHPAPAVAHGTAGVGRPHAVPAAARTRFLASLAGIGPMGHLWLLQGQAPGLDDGARHRAMLLDLAENGDGVEFRNLHAALLLKRGGVLQAVRQLRIADQIAAGYPPTLFNRALCAMMTGLPDQALAWIVRYRARFPRDEQAMRLHFNLLLQADRPEKAMDELAGFLARQPPAQPLFLEAAVQAARMGRDREAIAYLETARHGQPASAIGRIYQSPAFREIRLTPEGTAFAGRLARQARASLATASAATGIGSAALSPARLPVDPKFH